MDEAARKKLVAARTALLLSQPFFGALALRLELVEDEAGARPSPDHEATMYTDGLVLGYAPSFVNRLTRAELMGVIAHEVMHVAMGHPWRRSGREPHKWNIACDYAIDPLILQNNGLSLPLVGNQRGHVDKRFAGLSAEQIYDLLPQEQVDNDDAAYGQVKDAPASGTAEGEAAAREWQAAVVQAAHAARQAGKLPANLEHLIDDIKGTRVNWRDVLRRYLVESVQADWTWLLPNRRYTPHGLYLPAIQSEPTGTVVVVLDTSGSIADDELRNLFGEVRSIIEEVRPSKLVLYQADAKVQKVEELGQDEQPSLKVKGRGGTDFRPVFKDIEARGLTPCVLVYLTDGEGTFPQSAPPYPMIWALTQTGVKVPFGEAFEVDINR